MAKTKKIHHRAKATIPISVVLGFAPGIGQVWNNRSSVQSMANAGSKAYLGYDPAAGVFNPSYMKAGLLPVAIGFAVHRFVGGSLGVNRMLAGARIPLLRL